MKRILVTGSEGYIGSVLCPLLRRAGLEVIGLDVKTGWDATRDALPLDGVTGVVPLAALVGAKLCEQDPKGARAVNVGAAKQLAESLDGRPCVYLTTDSGYAPSNRAWESDPFYPRSVYARTKHEAAEILRAKGATVFRLASLFGESPAMRDDLLAHFFVKTAVETGKTPYVNEPETRRAFVHVDDVCQAILHALLLGNQPCARVYNLTSGDRLTKYDLVEQVAWATGASETRATFDNLHEAFGGGDEDARDFWLESAWPRPMLRRLSAEIPSLVTYYRERLAK